MTAILDDPDRRGLIANAAAFVATCIVVNGLVFGLGWTAGSAAVRPPLIPPGPVVGIVWTILFACMGAARWAYARDTRDRDWRHWAVVALAVVCLAFPFYTRGFADQEAGYVGTLATLAAALGVVAALAPRSRTAAAWIVPTVVWTGWVAIVGTIFGRI